jgi:hypothetical protein
MAETSAVIVLVAGGITFTDKWYWSKAIDWKIPVATLLAAAGIDALAKLDNKAATILSLLVLLGAVTTKFNGHSAVDTVTSSIGTKKTTATAPVNSGPNNRNAAPTPTGA